MVVLARYHLPVIGQDFPAAIRPALLLFLSGKSPYAAPGFYNPPWALVPLIPLAILPVEWGSAILSVANLLVFALIAAKMGAKPAALVLFLIAPQILSIVLDPNIDWLAALGFVLPPQIGVFFVLMKPQMGVWLALYWAVDALRAGGIKKAATIAVPVSLAFLLSFAIYGLYPLRAAELNHASWNASLWPASLPFGLALVVSALKYKRPGLAILAAPFLSPYVGAPAWGVAALGLLPGNLEFVAYLLGLQALAGFHAPAWFASFLR
jgi:hypothetical protein